MLILSEAFKGLGRSQLAALGGELPIALIPHPFATLTREQVSALAPACADAIAEIAVGGRSAANEAVPASRSEIPAVRAQSIEVPEDLGAFNDECEVRRWGDGLPLVPPTRERVAAMLAATRRAPTDIIAHLAPGFGVASVERIAINAVMAGCRPELLPVLIAAVEAVADARFNLQGIQATTGPATPFVVVNGPLAAKLGFNGGVNCLGQGTRANSTLGRALRLVMQNIGLALPGDMDRATQGTPGKQAFCCAENEAASPWEPLHVERGLAREESTVTAIAAASTLDMNTHAATADDLLRVIADSMIAPTTNDYHFAGEPWLVISPEHAQVLMEGGYDKARVKQALWERSRMQAGRFARTDYERASHTRRAELGEFRQETPVPVAPTAQEIGIVVAGGPGAHSVYVPSFGLTRAVTKAIAC
jgi:hypothetical protein